MAETSPSPRRGRPRSFDPHEVMQQVQDAFWKGGFEGTSIGDLAGATGLNRPSLYGAFGDKHALYIQALQQYRDATQAAGRKILEDAPTLRTALEDLFPRCHPPVYRRRRGARLFRRQHRPARSHARHDRAPGARRHE